VPSNLVVDIADMKASADPSVELITYSLGSCIGVAIWDKAKKVGGLLHYLLAESRISPDKAKANPAMFADTGIPLLFRSVYKLGGDKKCLVVKVAGGAALFDTSSSMNIGKHNYTMLRKIFWKNGVMIDGEHIGGSVSRTMRLDVSSGRVTVENRKMGRVDL
jgi:chemotaxis protein CheD